MCIRDSYIPKPFSIEVLRKKVQAVLKRTGGGNSRIRYRDLDAVSYTHLQGRKGVQATKQNIVKAKDGIQKFKEKRAAQSLQKQAQTRCV